MTIGAAPLAWAGPMGWVAELELEHSYSTNRPRLKIQRKDVCVPTAVRVATLISGSRATAGPYPCRKRRRF